jgi:hypothetical protein
MELNWYLTDWTMTTNTIDYGIKSVDADGDKTKVSLERIGEMPMPLDILVVGEDGTQETYYIPLRMMFGEKENPYPSLKRTVLDNWAWAYPNYEFVIDMPKEKIQAIMIDPSQLMADVDGENNVYQVNP